MAEKENYLLTTKNVNLFYGKKQALFDINLSFPKNGITALIGPSGSGKTTYLRSLNRMHDLTPGVKVEGKFLFHNNDIYSDNFDLVDLRKRIGMVFQQPTPFPFSIYDNVAFGLRLGKKYPSINWMKMSKKLYAKPEFGMKLKTGWERMLWVYQVANNNVSVSRAFWRRNRIFCYWMSQPAHSIRFQVELSKTRF